MQVQESNNGFDPAFISRHEDVKVEALKEYYEENQGKDEVMLKVAVNVGRWGVPFLVIIFSVAYWVVGITKYYTG